MENLFCCADLDGFHHLAGGDDGAAESLGRGGHRRVGGLACWRLDAGSLRME